ncbi:MAG TPA: hypothetical protein PLX79_04265 [Candidatus Dojkabacteria bacterium]|nr:hypothetical protein [Candidatus Dojkabacteria bacterium]
MYLVKVKVDNLKVQGKDYFAEQFIPLRTLVYCSGSQDIEARKD